MLEVETGELLLVRFRPMNLNGFMDDATDSFNDEPLVPGDPPLYSVSVFGLVKTEEETVEHLVERICKEAPVGGRTIWLASQSAVGAEVGCEVRLSEPPPNHYDVILGNELRIPDVEKLVKCFEPGREVNPAHARRRGTNPAAGGPGAD